jgi:PKD repeat protein
LLSVGGNGSNDFGNNYNVNSAGFNSAGKIAYRGLTNYFTNSTDYNAARTLTIQAAADLYGACSMEAEATTNAWYAVGVGSPYSAPSIAANFYTYTNTCGFPATLNFTNTSTGANTYNWNFGDGKPNTADVNPSHVFDNPGTYTITIVASDAGCGTSSTASLTITLNNTNPFPTPVNEGFESNMPNSWVINNPDNDAPWEIVTTVAKTGSKCLGFNNCNGNGATDMSGRRDLLQTASYDFSSAFTPSLSFDVASTTISDANGHIYADTLIIWASYDCGNVWYQVYNKAGSALATAPNIVQGSTGSAACWTPSTTEWRNDFVDLTWIAAGKPNVSFIIENRSGWGQWMFLDNINISNTPLVKLNSVDDKHYLNICPNPANSQLNFNTVATMETYSVINTLGQTIINNHTINDGNNTETIDISGIECGIYMLKIKNKDATIKTIKFVKQ